MQRPKPPFRLREIKIEVTHDCMLNCVHCSSLAEADTGRCMDWAACKRILREAAEMGVEEVAFSGGEPLLWANIVDAVDFCTSLNMSAFLYTTGIVPHAEALISQLKKAGLVRIMLSLLGETGWLHDAITLTSGSFLNTVSAARHSVEVGLETEFHFVPLSHTFKALPVIATIAKDLRVKRVSVLRLVPQGRGADSKDIQLNRLQNLELRKIIKLLRNDGHDIRVGSPYNFLMLSKHPQCLSGIDRLTIGPDLKIFPCDAFKQIEPESVGVSSEFSDLGTHPLHICWEQSPYLLAIRHYLMSDFGEQCQACDNIANCGSGCVAQKFHTNSCLCKSADPMCLLKDDMNDSLGEL